MNIKVTPAIAAEILVKCHRDYYSEDGIKAILDYYDEIDPNAEFDAVGICCDFNEYGEGAALSLKDFCDD